MYRRTGKKLTSLQYFLLVIVFSAAIVSVLFGGIPFITQKVAERYLADFGAFIADHARKEHGMEATLSYSSVKAGAFGMATHAEVKDIVLTWKDPAGAEITQVKTPRALVSMGRGLSEELNVDFPAPLEIFSAYDQPLIVRFEGTPRYTLSQDAEIQGHRHNLSLPPKLLVASAQTPDQPEYIITYNAGPVVEWHTSRQTAQAGVKLQAQNLVAADARSGVSFSVASLDVATGKTPDGDTKMKVDVAVNARDIGYKQANGALEGPYNLKLAISGKRGLPVLGQPQAEAEYTISEAALSTDRYGLSAKGTMRQTVEDSLPFGNGEVVIAGLNAFAADEGIGPEIRSAVTEALGRIMGQDITALPEVRFMLSREKLSPLVVGNTTFQELAAFMFARLVLGVSTPVAMPVPDAAPALAPSAPANIMPPVPPASNPQ